MEGLVGRAKDKCLSGHEEFMTALDLEKGQGMGWDTRSASWYLGGAGAIGASQEQPKRKTEEAVGEPPAKRQQTAASESKG